jgi:hypothetical protein
MMLRPVETGFTAAFSLHQSFDASNLRIWRQISLIRGDASLFQDGSIPDLFRKIPCFL